MKNQSFGKGLSIALVISMFMWGGIYLGVSALTQADEAPAKAPIEQVIDNRPQA